MATEVEFKTKGGAAVEAAQEKINKTQRQGRQELQLTNKEVQRLRRVQQQVLRGWPAPQRLIHVL
jgi:hypothetical protein